MPGVNLAFFSLAGASLKLDTLRPMAWIGGLVCLVRMAAIYAGSFIGCWASECPADHRKRMWQTMLTQVRLLHPTGAASIAFIATNSCRAQKCLHRNLILARWLPSVHVHSSAAASTNTMTA